MLAHLSRPVRFRLIFSVLIGLCLPGCSGSGSSGPFSRPLAVAPVTPQALSLAVVQNNGANLKVSILGDAIGVARPVSNVFGVTPFVADIRFGDEEFALLNFIAIHSATGGVPQVGDIFDLATDTGKASCTFFRDLDANYRATSGIFQLKSITGSDYVFSFTGVRFVADSGVPNNPTTGNFTLTGQVKVTYIPEALNRKIPQLKLGKKSR